MNKIPYSYCVLRYVHDPGAGETLNIGVLMYAPTVPWIGIRVEKRFRRLSETFRGFDRENFRTILRRLESGVQRMQSRLGDIPGLEAHPTDVNGLGLELWPDPDVSFRFGPKLTGVTTDLARTLDELFERMITSQTPRDTRRLTEAALWATLKAVLDEAQVLSELQPKTFAVDGVDIRFDHAFKNGKWHVLQPLSLDYKRPSQLEREATIWLGKATALREHPELGRLYLLVGGPKSASPEIQRAFHNARTLLSKLPPIGRVVDEDETQSFGEELVRLISHSTRH